MRRKLLVVGFTLVLAGSLFGQRRGPGGMQGNQSAGGGCAIDGDPRLGPTDADSRSAAPSTSHHRPADAAVAHLRLMNGLSLEQQEAVRNRAQQMQTTREQFQQMSEALEMELALKAPDPAKVRQQAREMESAVNKISTQQQQLNNDLGIEE